MFKQSEESAVFCGGKKVKMVAADFSLRNKIGGGIMKKRVLKRLPKFCGGILKNIDYEIDGILGEYI